MAKEEPTTTTVRLLEWYVDHRRELPWRKTQDPYHIWVAEVMLQQTQVTTVIPYYERFLARFPTVAALAAASLDDVLKLWEGLGYYVRARHLQAAARRVISEFDGRIPDTLEALLSLPGIGRYTAGAVLSIASGQDVPAVDGNARRVLGRVYAVEEDTSRGVGQRILWELATSLLPRGRAGEFNQALMDLGASICTPRRPQCGECPLAELCQAHHLDCEEQFPVRRQRPSLPHYEVTSGVVWNGPGNFLIAKRPFEGLLGGLWAFPGGKREPGESLEDCLRREVAEELEIQVAVGALLAVIKHTYTHFRITLHAFHCYLQGGQPRAVGYVAWSWVTLNDLDRFAFSAADHKIIAALRAPAHRP